MGNYQPSPFEPFFREMFGRSVPAPPAEFVGWEEFQRRWPEVLAEEERRRQAIEARIAEDLMFRELFLCCGVAVEDAIDCVTLLRLFRDGEPGLLEREKVRLVLRGERELD